MTDREISDYCIVEGQDEVAGSRNFGMERSVQDALKDGWQPYGKPTVWPLQDADGNDEGVFAYVQPMVKYKNK